MLVTRSADGTMTPFDPSGLDTLEKPCYDFKGLSGSMPYLRTLIRNMEGIGWEPYASDHEDGTPSSSSTGAMPTPSRPRTATRSSR